MTINPNFKTIQAVTLQQIRHSHYDSFTQVVHVVLLLPSYDVK